MLPLPKLLIWNIYGPNMEMVWDNIWLIYGHCMVFIWDVSSVSSFTATEYRNWLLYYSLPCLKGILPDDYYQHYALLVGGITLLSGRSISPGQLQMAGKFLIHFVEMFDVYYGKKYYM